MSLCLFQLKVQEAMKKKDKLAREQEEVIHYFPAQFKSIYSNDTRLFIYSLSRLI